MQRILKQQLVWQNAITSFEARDKKSYLDNLISGVANKGFRHLFYGLTGETHDFLGVNYYYTFGLGLDRRLGIPTEVNIEQLGDEKSFLGWGIYPKGLEDILVDLKGRGLPIYVTENGIATHDDQQRVRFLVGHLKAVHNAICKGANVKGYFHWSAFDNMELHKGFEPTFGLVKVDFNSPALSRTPRPSAYVYKEIIQHNGL